MLGVPLCGPYPIASQSPATNIPASANEQWSLQTETVALIAPWHIRAARSQAVQRTSAPDRRASHAKARGCALPQVVSSVGEGRSSRAPSICLEVRRGVVRGNQPHCGRHDPSNRARHHGRTDRSRRKEERKAKLPGQRPPVPDQKLDARSNRPNSTSDLASEDRLAALASICPRGIDHQLSRSIGDAFAATVKRLPIPVPQTASRGAFSKYGTRLRRVAPRRQCASPPMSSSGGVVWRERRLGPGSIRSQRVTGKSPKLCRVAARGVLIRCNPQTRRLRNAASFRPRNKPRSDVRWRWFRENGRSAFSADFRKGRLGPANCADYSRRRRRRC